MLKKDSLKNFIDYARFFIAGDYRGHIKARVDKKYECSIFVTESVKAFGIYDKNNIDPWIETYIDEINEYGILFDKSKQPYQMNQLNQFDNEKWYKLIKSDISFKTIVEDKLVFEEPDVIREGLDRAYYIMLNYNDVCTAKRALLYVLKSFCNKSSSGRWKGLHFTNWVRAFETTKNVRVNDEFWESSFIRHCPDHLLYSAYLKMDKLKELITKSSINWAYPTNKINSITEVIELIEISNEHTYNSPLLPNKDRYNEYKDLWLKKYKRLPKMESLLWNLAFIEGWDGYWNFKIPQLLNAPHDPFSVIDYVTPNPHISRHQYSLDLEYLRWVCRGHKRLNIETEKIPRKYFKEDMSSRKILKYYEKYLSEEEFEEIEEEYEDINMDNLTTVIPRIKVVSGNYTAEVLDPNDKIWTRLGYITNCCQHLGGMGETAMMYGALSQYGGFWVVKKKGIIIGQSEMWESAEGTLVFDNIELSNDRDISEIEDILYLWCGSSPYRNIIIGKGYSDIDLDGFPEAPKPIQIPCDKITDEIYTDANECIWIKKDNKLIYRSVQ